MELFLCRFPGRIDELVPMDSAFQEDLPVLFYIQYLPASFFVIFG